MQEICTSLMVVSALFSYCVFCYIDTSMLICINQSAFNNVQFNNTRAETSYELVVTRIKYAAAYRTRPMAQVSNNQKLTGYEARLLPITADEADEIICYGREFSIQMKRMLASPSRFNLSDASATALEMPSFYLVTTIVLTQSGKKKYPAYPAL